MAVTANEAQVSIFFANNFTFRIDFLCLQGASNQIALRMTVPSRSTTYLSKGSKVKERNISNQNSNNQKALEGNRAMQETGGKGKILCPENQNEMRESARKSSLGN